MSDYNFKGVQKKVGFFFPLDSQPEKTHLSWNGINCIENILAILNHKTIILKRLSTFTRLPYYIIIQINDR